MSGTSDNPPRPEGWKVPATSDGRGVPVPLTPEEAADMRRRSDESRAAIEQVLRDESALLGGRFAEVLANGSATVLEPTGTFTVTLHRPRWRDGVLLSEGARRDGRGTRGRLRIPRKPDSEYLEDAVTLTLAKGVAWLREP